MELFGDRDAQLAGGRYIRCTFHKTEERNLECSDVFFIPIPDSFRFSFFVTEMTPPVYRK
jgi:hypothetical protein